MSVLASPARMVALVRTGRTHIFVPAQKALRVRHFNNIQIHEFFQLKCRELRHILCLHVCQSTGFNCEVNLDDCKSKPCDYGRCIDKINGYECACEPGYTGEHWVEFTGAGRWSLELWEGQVGQVAGGSTPTEQWCQIAYVEWGWGGREKNSVPNLIHTQCANFVFHLKGL